MMYRDGLLLLNKKSGLTSFDSLRVVKKAFATSKAGHTGTLDKFATGLLLVLVGQGVKLASLFDNSAKEYIAVLKFGEETDTLDPEGNIIATEKLPSRKEVDDVLDNFRGEILQAPPAYSAVHIKGRRAYELAREGKNPEMRKRPVTINELEILSWDLPEVTLRVNCSAGTYIRSLARDLAIAAGSRAYLTGLKRTRVGNFCLEDAAEEMEIQEQGEKALNAFRPLDRKLFNDLSLPCFVLEGKAVDAFTHGGVLETILASAVQKADHRVQGAVNAPLSAGVFMKTAPGAKDRILGVIEQINGKWRYSHVLAGC